MECKAVHEKGRSFVSISALKILEIGLNFLC